MYSADYVLCHIFLVFKGTFFFNRLPKADLYTICSNGKLST